MTKEGIAMANDARDAVRHQFSRNATDYRDEPLFAEGEDLRRMVESIPLSGMERVLDVATGAGHTALAFAPHVHRCIGIDLTEAMVRVAAQLARDRGVDNVEFVTGDAENLPFPDETFDVVSCRFAVHHFPDARTAIREVARVLKPGGAFLLVDHYAPEDDELDAFVNELDRLRDPSHVRENRLSEYRWWFAESGLCYDEKLKWDLRLQFDNWVERARTPMDKRRELAQRLRTAPIAARETYRIELTDAGEPVSFCLKCALVHGTKTWRT
jgi:ubiquinone/menaquinone biosynthesis C-methylase UbiE